MLYLCPRINDTYMKSYRIAACCLMAVTALSVQARKNNQASIDSLAQRQIVERYTEALQRLVVRNDSLAACPVEEHLPHPYYYKLFAPGTLYMAPLRQRMGFDWGSDEPAAPWPSLELPADDDLTLNRSINEALMNTYVRHPGLIGQTESELSKEGGLRDDIGQTIRHEVKLVEKAEEVELGDDVGAIAVVVKRPNFWKFSGTTSLQFMQAYYSDNWYQGGENNYSMLAQVTLNANYNNKQKLQWENKLEMQLGFQTTKSDKEHQFQTTSDLLRFTSKVGYQAAKRWYYTTSVQAYTQFHPKYASNSHNVQSDFMSPFNLVVSVGMDYKLNLKRFTSSAVFAPVAYNFRYVDRTNLATRFGLKERHSTYNNFGPNITVNYKWDIYKNISWTSRIYWFSNLKMTNIEWENTFNFSINKYLSAKIFAYPKIDDSSKKYKSEDMEKYFMFKEWLSLGVNYSF